MDIKFEDVTFYALEISCPVILGMTFLYDYSILVNPREQTLWVPNVEGSYLKIPSDPGRKQLPVAETG